MKNWKDALKAPKEEAYEKKFNRNTNSTNLVVMNQNREDEEISFSMVYNPSEAKSLSKEGNK